MGYVGVMGMAFGFLKLGRRMCVIAGMEMRWEVGREVGDGRGCGEEKNQGISCNRNDGS